MPKIYGVTNLEYRVSPHEMPTIHMELAVGEGFNPVELYHFSNWDDYFPGNVVVPCQWCGQWAARKCACSHCGGAVE